jgi:hypothetical protein
MPYDVEAIRKKLQKSMSSRFSDPDEFRPAKAEADKAAIKYRFFVLGPLQAGDKLKSGEVKQSMEQFFLQHGNHWIGDRPYPCPRIWDNSDCQICKRGFDELRDIPREDVETRRKIRDRYLSSSYYMVNIYFPNWKQNPEELRGKVKYYNAPKTVLDIWVATLMNDDKGDQEEALAHGIFFDETAAFLFQLEVTKQGKSNSYKTSKFVTSDGEPIPMVGKKGEPNEKGIAILLKNRLNLWDKIDTPDQEALDKAYRFLVEGDDEPETNSGGWDEDESTTKPEKKTQKPPKQSKKVEEDVDDTLPFDADDSGDDALSAETPIKEDKDSGGNDSGDDIESSEIDMLLSQLDEED